MQLKIKQNYKRYHKAHKLYAAWEKKRKPCLRVMGKVATREGSLRRWHLYRA